MTMGKEIVEAYIKTSSVVSKNLRKNYSKLNLTYPQAVVLSILDANGEMPISLLAELSGSANSTISGIIDRLERAGYVERKRSGNDHRVIYVDVTPAYQQIREELQNTFADSLSEKLNTITEEDQQKMIEGLNLLREIFSEEQE